MKIAMLLVSFLTSFSVLSQKKEVKIYGIWIEKIVNENETIECPYKINIESNYVYKILNVCYGSDPTLPIVEEGNWSYDTVKNIIVLKKRRSIDNNDLFYNAEASLTIHIKDIKKDYMTIYFETSKKKEVLIEKLVRVKN